MSRLKCNRAHLRLNIEKNIIRFLNTCKNINIFLNIYNTVCTNVKKQRDNEDDMVCIKVKNIFLGKASFSLKNFLTPSLDIGGESQM